MPSQGTQFWMTWLVRLAGTIGTLLAVTVALFKDRIIAWLLPVQLQLELVSPVGVKGTMGGKSDGTSTTEELARYYNMRLTNRRSRRVATQSLIYLIQIQEPGPDGDLQVRWSGDVPLKWQWHNVLPVLRTVGPDAIADLCYIVKGKWLDFQTLVHPSSLKPYRERREGTLVDLTITLQARAVEGSSLPTSFRITWDGRWEDGDTEMSQHLKIRPAS